MYDFHHDTTPVAAKDHTCHECGQIIQKGQKHHLQKGTCYGEFYTWRVHADCAELYWQANRDAGICLWDEALPLSDFDIEDLHLLRGRFPHAVCRQELNRELEEVRWQRIMSN